MIGSALQRPRSAEPDFRIGNNSFSIDPKNRRYTGVSVGIRHLTTIEQDSLCELVLSDEARELALILVPGVDRQDDQTGASAFLGDSTQVRSLRTTGRSPVCPKSEQHRLAAEVTQPNRLAREIGELEVRRRFAFPLRGPACATTCR